MDEMNKRIIEVREYLGFSQAKFAQKIGRSPGHISNMYRKLSKMKDIP